VAEGRMRGIASPAMRASSEARSVLRRPHITRIGDPDGTRWRPAETDVSIRPGWFWHEQERPRDGAALLDLYLSSVGPSLKM